LQSFRHWFNIYASSCAALALNENRKLVTASA